MNHISQNKRHVRGGKWRVAPAAMTLGLALFLTGCESLLEVELFGTTSADILDQPDTAELMLNSAITRVECGYSRFATGNPLSDVYLNADNDVDLEYQDVIATAGGDSCFTFIDILDDYFEWFGPIQEARFHAEDAYFRYATLFTDGDGGPLDIAPFATGDFGSLEHMQGIVAIYAAIPYIMFGEHLCEVAIEISGGTARLPAATTPVLLSPDSALDIAEGWINTGLTHLNAYWADTVANGGDAAEVRELPHGITDDLEQMAYALRARVKWAREELTEAAVDAALVSNGFFAYATRAANDPARQNHIHAAHFRVVEAALAGPINWWVDPHPALTYPGQPWPLDPMGTGGEALIPFTGYLALAIDNTNGRAVDPFGNAITLITDPTFEVDTRVQHATGIDREGADVQVQQKFTAIDDDIPMVNWKEMVLIRAQADPASAVALVNEIRTADGLTNVLYGPVGGEIEDMIFEEKRRALFLEGRFWSTKIQNQSSATVKLWFPRELDDQEDPRENVLQGGVRMRMQTSEFDSNPRINRADRAAHCGFEQRPVNPSTGDDP